MNESELHKKSFFKEWWSFLVSIIILAICFLISFIDAFRQSIGIHEWLSANKIDSRLFFLFGLVLPVIERLLILAIKQNETNRKLKQHIEKTDEVHTLIKNLSPIGIFKEITNPVIWEFEEKIWGWNPNWSLENKGDDHRIKDGLKKIHLNRITNPSLTEVNYFFLEGYQLFDENGSDKGMQFSKDDFLRYLTDIANQKKYRSQIESKYKIWVIPKNFWIKNGSLHIKIKRYRDFIVIKGMKNGKEVALLFMNFHWCCNAIGHKYFLEITDTTEVVTNFSSFLKDIETSLKAVDISHKVIKYNKTTKTYVCN